ncbi:hypothetical protein NSMS1_02930 [Nostoc sp. MS1]|nr:hypothetical protein NSMS1_02930 [Nostoc sp. MS1]
MGEDVACFSNVLYETLTRTRSVSETDATRSRSVSAGFTRRVENEEAEEQRRIAFDYGLMTNY